MKATSIFGGVQVFNILIQLVRSKVVAVLLGPAGMGIMGLFQTALALVSSATNFGLGTSAVRDISEAATSDDEEKIAQTVGVFRKLVWFTGGLGLVLTAVLAPLLSKITFGNYDYTYAFIILALTLLAGQLSSGQLVLLQGLLKIKLLAKANIIASLAGLIASLPLFWFFGTQGIVPALVVIAVITLAIEYYYASRIKIRSSAVTVAQALVKGKGMLKMGFLISLSGLITVAASYVVRIFISNTGTLEDVGLFSAGFAIIGTYVGLVFSAMGTDYYPRLSAVNHDMKQASELIIQQAEIAVIILAPLVVIFMIFIDWITVLIYSQKFLPISGMVHWAMLGILFKAVSWAVAFLFLAKADSKIYFWNELVANIYLLLLNCAGYYWLGLKGLGISFMVSYLLYLIQVVLITRLRYGMYISPRFFLMVAGFMVQAASGFAIAHYLESWPRYIAGMVIIGITATLSLVLLNRRMPLLNMIKTKIKK
ncbi:O-antigen translocase [Chryseobacterium sp. 6424]|uniref:O-antigen translocase n=1 Tax=Chryseobacterium sp. 6424 TaxID=2039166 RepID=UPI0013CEBDA5|nr:O-antigen translocase [Chryseobacterium sp. 6424]